MTPLHVLIVGAMTRSEQVRFRAGIFIATSDNEKNRRYAEKMREFCESVRFVVTPPDSDYGRCKHLRIWYRRLRYRLSFRALGRFDMVCVPSSLSHYLYALLSAFRPAQIRSYDDGLLNIQRDSQILTKRTSVLARIFYLLAGISYWPERIVARSSVHYTIYDAPNAYSNTKRIRLYTEGRGEGGQSGRVVTLLLGPAPEAPVSVWAIIEQAAVDIVPDFYLPHPRDPGDRVSGVPRLDTALIVEDYVMQALCAKPGIRFRVFGFESSALINLSVVAGVSTYTLMPDCEEYAVSRQLMLGNGVRNGLTVGPGW